MTFVTLPNRSWSTARLRCAPVIESDVDDLFDLDADPVVMRYIDGGVPPDRSRILERISRQDQMTWVASRTENDRFVGWFLLRRTGPGELEIGYRIRRIEWGNGLATEGGRGLLAVAFDNDKVDRVWGQTMTVNRASRAVMERLGMRLVRRFHTDWGSGEIHGSELGDVEYSITRTEWSSATSPTDHQSHRPNDKA